MGWDDVSRANSIAILCAARSATAQPADGILNSVIRLSVGAVFRASVRLMRGGVIPLKPDDRLDRAMELFVENDLLALPVVDGTPEGRIVGIVKRR